MKKEFGKKFHIHIYLSTKLVDKNKLTKLAKYIDEVRFHPLFLINKSELDNDIKKIKLGEKIFGKRNNGVEMPMIPEKKEEILNFLFKVKDNISFVNLNEFELSETNFDILTKKYPLKEGGYIVNGSLEAGKWVLTQLQKKKIKLNAHVCTAELKNSVQFVNRLKRHDILPGGRKTQDGTVIYLAVYAKNKKEWAKMKKEIKGFVDPKKKRIILLEKEAKRILKNGGAITKVEEFPTYDAIEVESEEIK